MGSERSMLDTELVLVDQIVMNVVSFLSLILNTRVLFHTHSTSSYDYIHKHEFYWLRHLGDGYKAP